VGVETGEGRKEMLAIGTVDPRKGERWRVRRPEETDHRPKKKGGEGWKEKEKRDSERRKKHCVDETARTATTIVHSWRGAIGGKFNTRDRT